jgi:hypothetical protein
MKTFEYTIIDTKPLQEGISFLLNLPYKKYKFDRKKSLALLAQINTKCVCCGVEGTKFCLGKDKANQLHWDLYTDDGIGLTIDHIIPKKDGGKNLLENLQLMCLECNNLKMHIPERIIGYKKLLELLDDETEISLTIKKTPFIRIDYWKKLSDEIFFEIKDFFTEEKIWDEDCGFQYVYYFKH